MIFRRKLTGSDFSTVKLFYGAFFIFITLGILTDASYAQKIPPVKLRQDVRSLSAGVLSDTIKSSSTTKFRMKKDPWKAVLYSALLPGAGQFYNKSYWKIPIIAGLGGYFVYEIVRNNNSYLDYRDQYSNSQTPENPEGDLRLKDFREFYSDQRDDFIIYGVILYVVNLLDAFVDAHLYDFDVSDNIKFGILQNDRLVKVTYGF